MKFLIPLFLILALSANAQTVDGNNRWDISDATYIINYIFGGGPAPIMNKTITYNLNDTIKVVETKIPDTSWFKLSIGGYGFYNHNGLTDASKFKFEVYVNNILTKTIVLPDNIHAMLIADLLLDSNFTSVQNELRTEPTYNSAQLYWTLNDEADSVDLRYTTDSTQFSNWGALSGVKIATFGTYDTYIFRDMSQGKYYFACKSHNSTGWSDISNIVTRQVKEKTNNPPIGQ